MNANEEEARKQAEYRLKKSKGPNFSYILPLVYAPMLPMIRITLRHQPVLRDRIFTAAVGAALIHGAYLCSTLYNSESS